MSIFEKRSRVTVHRELPADLDTPVSVYLRLQGRGPSFLLESVTGGEQVARYSFIGVDPGEVYVLRGRTYEVHTRTGVSKHTVPPGMDPLDILREVLKAFGENEAIHGLPRFFGGLVGYLGYDLVRYFEATIDAQPHAVFPDAVFMHADTLVAFDHAFDRLLLIATAESEAAAQDRLDRIERRLAAPLPRSSPATHTNDEPAAVGNMSRAAYMDGVLAIQEHIKAGDIFQGVLSQKLARRTSAAPFDIYRTLRRINPSPYMFHFDFGTLATPQPFRMIGSSPEMHVRLENGIAALRPIAGTRPRGATPGEDHQNENDLLADPKERAEHLMLIDLARNDLGRVCDYGTVRVPEQFVVERYSHVMHIVSHTEGVLREGLDAIDLLRATFPAGTVSGAPKIRAMQILNDLEPEPRGPYAGAVGYIGYDGNADTCIALRTLLMHGDEIQIQAGAGIVADSDPALEYQETLNKAQALLRAVSMAEQPARRTSIYAPGD